MFLKAKGLKSQPMSVTASTVFRIMAPVSVKASSISDQLFSPAMLQENMGGTKRKFEGEAPVLVDLDNNPTYQVLAKRFNLSRNHGQASSCDLCGINLNPSDSVKLDRELGSFGAVTGSGSMCEAGPSHPIEAIVKANKYCNADCSDLSESQLKELVLENLNHIFKSSIKKIIACGYTEEAATKAVLRSGFNYGHKDPISNIVDSTLKALNQEIDISRETIFHDLEQLKNYTLTELVCSLRAVKSYLSTRDAIWCLLICDCDMNVFIACATYEAASRNFIRDAAQNASTSTSSLPQQLKTDGKCFDSKRVPLIPCAHSSIQQEMHAEKQALALSKAEKNLNLNELNSKKGDSSSSKFDTVGKSPAFVGNIGSSRKVSSKRDSLLRLKSIHLEKSNHLYGCKGYSRSGKLIGLARSVLDRRLKSMGNGTGVSLKSVSLRINKETTIFSPPHDYAALPISQISPESLVNKDNSPAAASSLAISTKTISASSSDKRNDDTVSIWYAGIPYDKVSRKWVPRDEKDEEILKLAPRLQELQNQLQECTDRANKKIMQVTRRLSKDSAELKTLKQEREKSKREKQALDETTKKKLVEMENALAMVNEQVGQANSIVQRLEVENSDLKYDIAVEKLRAAGTSVRCEEVTKREKTTLANLESIGNQKTKFHEELAIQKLKYSQLQQQLVHARDHFNQTEAKWKQEKAAKEESLMLANFIKIESEKLEASYKSEEDAITLKAETNLQKYKDDIKKIEQEISQLKLKTDSSKIAAMKGGINGNTKSSQTQQEARILYNSDLNNNLSGVVKRERECVMCLSEEKSVVFLPCAHQVVCTECNVVHEKQGMKECPSCRSLIQRRINVRYARS